MKEAKETEGDMLRFSFLERAIKNESLVKTGEKLQLKNIKPNTEFALDNTYYKMLISSTHYCKFEDCVRREFYTTKTNKFGEVLAWQN